MLVQTHPLIRRILAQIQLGFLLSGDGVAVGGGGGLADLAPPLPEEFSAGAVHRVPERRQHCTDNDNELKRNVARSLRDCLTRRRRRDYKRGRQR